MSSKNALQCYLDCMVKRCPSEDLAKTVAKLEVDGVSDMYMFIVGGAFGVSDELT